MPPHPTSDLWEPAQKITASLPSSWRLLFAKCYGRFVIPASATGAWTPQHCPFLPPPIAFSPSPPQPQLSRVTPRCSQWLQPTEISPCSSFTTLLNSTLMRILHYTVLIALYIKHKTCSLHTAVKLEATTHVTEGVIHTTDISKITLQTLTGFSACFLQTQLFISMSLHHYY